MQKRPLVARCECAFLYTWRCVWARAFIGRNMHIITCMYIHLEPLVVMSLVMKWWNNDDVKSTTSEKNHPKTAVCLHEHVTQMYKVYTLHTYIFLYDAPSSKQEIISCRLLISCYSYILCIPALVTSHLLSAFGCCCASSVQKRVMAALSWLPADHHTI